MIAFRATEMSFWSFALSACSEVAEVSAFLMEVSWSMTLLRPAEAASIEFLSRLIASLRELSDPLSDFRVAAMAQ